LKKQKVMNATRHDFQVNIFEEQLEEAALCLLHTILFHRTTGKFQYQVSRMIFLIITVVSIYKDRAHRDTFW